MTTLASRKPKADDFMAVSMAMVRHCVSVNYEVFMLSRIHMTKGADGSEEERWKSHDAWCDTASSESG